MFPRTGLVFLLEVIPAKIQFHEVIQIFRNSQTMHGIPDIIESDLLSILDHFVVYRGCIELIVDPDILVDHGRSCKCLQLPHQR